MKKERKIEYFCGLEKEIAEDALKRFQFTGNEDYTVDILYEPPEESTIINLEVRIVEGKDDKLIASRRFLCIEKKNPLKMELTEEEIERVKDWEELYIQFKEQKV